MADVGLLLGLAKRTLCCVVGPEREGGDHLEADLADAEGVEHSGASLPRRRRCWTCRSETPKRVAIASTIAPASMSAAI